MKYFSFSSFTFSHFLHHEIQELSLVDGKCYFSDILMSKLILNCNCIVKDTCILFYGFIEDLRPNDKSCVFLQCQYDTRHPGIFFHLT